MTNALAIAAALLALTCSGREPPPVPQLAPYSIWCDCKCDFPSTSDRGAPYGFRSCVPTDSVWLAANDPGAYCAGVCDHTGVMITKLVGISWPYCGGLGSSDHRVRCTAGYHRAAPVRDAGCLTGATTTPCLTDPDSLPEDVLGCNWAYDSCGESTGVVCRAPNPLSRAPTNSL